MKETTLRARLRQRLQKPGLVVKAAGIKVVLAGEGADELCAGYRFCERALGLGTETPPATHWPEPVLRLLATAAPDPALLAEGLPGLTAQARALGYPELMIGHLAGKLALARQLIHPDFAQRFSREDPFLAFFRRYDVARSLDGREPIKQVLNLWMRTGFANYVLGAERLDMASAVEQRLPFITGNDQDGEIAARYYRVIDYCYSKNISVIITCNTSLKELARIIGGRAWDRLQQMAPRGFMMDLAGVPSWRQMQSGRQMVGIK
jgi:asparagine synthetase B (glutamine-hydrolysing)